MKKLSIIAVICLAASVAARADIIPSFTGTSPGSGTNTVWNYVIDITSNQQVTAGDFFTIYDFGPFISGSATSPAGWTFSSSLVTAPPANTSPPDNPSLANLTWTYTGAPVLPTGTHLSGFSVTQATSSFLQSPPTKTGFFAASASSTTGAGGKIGNVGQVPIPVPVPEPTTLSLLAMAGIGSVLRKIRRRK